MLLLLAGLTVFVGIGAGSIPAAVLSALRPAQVLKGAIMRAGRGRLRRAMVVVQFALYILLMATTFTVNQQLEYLSGKNLGFNREQLVVLPLFSTDWSLLNRYETIEAEFLRHPDITSVSSSWATTAASGKLHDVRAQGEGAPRRMRLMRVDADFLDTYQIELVAGRNFSRDIQSDLTSAFLLNETAVEQLGWADPIGKQFEWMAGSREGTVIGVVGDFHFQPLRDRIQPLFMAHSAGIRS